MISQLLSGGSDRAVGPQPPQRPSRSNRKRPPRLCATPSPAQPSKRTSKRAKPDDAQDAPDVKAGAPAASGEDVKHTRKKPHLKKEPNTGASPTLRGTDSLLELEQRLSAGMSNVEVHGQDPGAARPSKRARRACGASAAAPATRQGVARPLQGDVAPAILAYLSCLCVSLSVVLSQADLCAGLQ